MGGVSANQALNDAALAWQADALVVHHGFFWGNEPRTIVKLRANRIGALMRADMSLFAFQLPLDAHRVVGNNAGLATTLGASVSAETQRLGGRNGFCFVVTLAAPVSLGVPHCPRTPVTRRASGQSDLDDSSRRAFTLTTDPLAASGHSLVATHTDRRSAHDCSKGVKLRG